MESPPAVWFPPIGFRFHPTESELLGYYLLKRIAHGSSCFSLVKDRDLYGQTEPWEIWKEDLRSRGINEEEEEQLPDLYFFTELQKKTKKSSNFSRLVGSGCWKGEDKGFKVKEYRTNRVLGLRKRFRYILGDPEQEGCWIMMEYTLDPSLLPNSQQPNNLVLCMLRFNKRAASSPSKKRKAAKNQEPEETLPSKKHLGISVFATGLKPCSADIKPQSHSVHAESQGESIFVPDHHPLGFSVPWESKETLPSKKRLELSVAAAALQPCLVDADHYHTLGFQVPCLVTKKEEEHHDDETYPPCNWGSEITVQNPAAGADSTDLTIDESWWNDLLHNVTFPCNGDNNNNYLELDDLFLDDLTVTALPDLPPTSPQ